MQGENPVTNGCVKNSTTPNKRLFYCVVQYLLANLASQLAQVEKGSERSRHKSEL